MEEEERVSLTPPLSTSSSSDDNYSQTNQSENTDTKDASDQEKVELPEAPSGTESASEESTLDTLKQRKKREKEVPPVWFQLFFHGKTEMVAVVSLIFMLFSILLQAHGKIKVERLMTKSAPRPLPLFHPSSTVDDRFLGDGVDILDIISKSEVTLIAYYAPWCAQCHELRWQLDQLAKHYKPAQVRFLAVNCWDPGGRCKQLYRMYTYPVLAIFTGSGLPTFYNGPYTADYLYRFITNAINPMERLNTVEEVVEFMLSTDICVIAFFDFAASSEPPGFRNYHAAAVKALERDPQRWIKFGVVTDPELAAKSLRMDSSRQLHLYSLTSSKYFAFPYREKAYRANEIVNSTFLSGQFDAWEDNKASGYWVPNGESVGAKSEQLALILTGGPLAILFTPREPLWEDLGPNTIYGNFRSVAHDYWDCVDNDRLRSARRVVHRRQRRREEYLQRQLPEDCKGQLRRQQQLKDCCSDVVLTTVTFAPHRNICDYCTPPSPKVPLSYLGTKKRTEPTTSSKEEGSFLKNAIGSRACRDFEIAPPSLIAYCCHQSEQGRKSILPCPHTGPCLQLRLSKTLAYDSTHKRAPPVVDDEALERTEATGLGCDSNRTLTFVAIDTRTHAFIRDQIVGGNALLASDSTLVIVKNASEDLYVLHNPSPRADEIRAFILSYHRSTLEAHRRSAVAQDTKEKRDDEIRLVELNRDNFKRVVLDGEADVVVFYSGGSWCGFCQGVYHVLLTVAAYFRDLDDSILFAEVDASVNDLDVPFAVDRYPSIIFYPGNGKSNSIAYPSYLPITVPNLLSFVMAHAHAEIRWRLALGVCGPTCTLNNRLKAAHRIRELRRETRVLRARMGFEASGMWSEEVEWGYDRMSLGDMYRTLLRRELARAEVERRTLKTFLRLTASVGKAQSLLRLNGKEAALLEWAIKQGKWFGKNSISHTTSSLLQ